MSAPLSAPDDAALLVRIAAGDETAFRHFADRHVGRMLRLAQSILGSAAEADEVAQDALLRVWRHAARWDGARGQPGTWIHTIVARLCVDRLRQRRHQPIEAASDVADPAPSVLEALSSRQEALALRAALASLPERQRVALTLFYHEELGGAEAAATLGITLRAYWSLLERARRALRHRMQRNPGLEPDR
ncbi:sigma-70 family RNA polymerase sigma factor [Falsiroseomonas selenitidurans]|uniref:RNA polymerase sigma factor n=1 Tax=Falsiroseomonas selenitidurans TaxID=2716335 RepID=A0ABX1E9S6_9PROT|nr:sigma-70 family RNA polymerase sigma factor [Falsiroseomonas selenitidurans]NKC31675.1 sigma-70 family RNA polymerase sigma factor [Falsiroseomonas selenitidurans]